MHDFITVVRNQRETATSGSEVENVEAGSVNKPSVSMIDCVDKNIFESGGDGKTKDHDVVISDKHSLVWSEEEISNDFVNQVLFETIVSVIDELKKNAASGVVSPTKT